MQQNKIHWLYLCACIVSHTFFVFTTQNLRYNILAKVCTHRIGTEIFSNGATNYVDFRKCPRLFSLHSFRGSGLANQKPTMIAIIHKILYNYLIEDSLSKFDFFNKVVGTLSYSNQFLYLVFKVHIRLANGWSFLCFFIL